MKKTRRLGGKKEILFQQQVSERSSEFSSDYVYGLDLQSELYRRKQDMQRKRSVMSIPILDTCTRPKETLMS